MQPYVSNLKEISLVVYKMAVYNHWSGLDWTIVLPLELEFWHYNSILMLFQKLM